jgi:hypothetical protein
MDKEVSSMRADFSRGLLRLISETDEEKDFLADLYTRVLLTEHPTAIPDPPAVESPPPDSGMITLGRRSVLEGRETQFRKPSR